MYEASHGTSHAIILHPLLGVKRYSTALRPLQKLQRHMEVLLT
jgi:hypothetical protein